MSYHGTRHGDRATQSLLPRLSSTRRINKDTSNNGSSNVSGIATTIKGLGTGEVDAAGWPKVLLGRRFSHIHTPIVDTAIRAIAVSNPKTLKQALSMVQEYFDECFPGAAALMDGTKFYKGRDRLKEAAFSLHQATERLYHCVLLVCTFYTPHVHNLGFQRTQDKRIDPRLTHVWPRETKRDRARFEKLKEAYARIGSGNRYHRTGGSAIRRV